MPRLSRVVRPVAGDALKLRVMGLGVYAPDLAPAAGRVLQPEVAPGAEFPVAVDGERLRVVRVPPRRAVAVLAVDVGVRRLLDLVVLVLVDLRLYTISSFIRAIKLRNKISPLWP